MSLHQCRCGHRVTLKQAVVGHAYQAVFRDAETDKEISDCPRCGERLYRQLVAGRLREVDTTTLNQKAPTA